MDNYYSVPSPPPGLANIPRHSLRLSRSASSAPSHSAPAASGPEALLILGRNITSTKSLAPSCLTLSPSTSSVTGCTARLWKLQDNIRKQIPCPPPLHSRGSFPLPGSTSAFF